MYHLHKTSSQSRLYQQLPSNAGVIIRWYPGINFTGNFTGTCLLWLLQLLALLQLGIGGEGRNRTGKKARYGEPFTGWRPRLNRSGAETSQVAALVGTS